MSQLKESSSRAAKTPSGETHTETSLIHRSVTCTCLHHLIDLCSKAVCMCVFSVTTWTESSLLTLHCTAVSVIVFLGPYLVLPCPLSHSLTEWESRLTFSLKGRGSSRHNVQAGESANRNAALPRHLLETSHRFSQRDGEFRGGVLGGMTSPTVAANPYFSSRPIW